MCCSSRLQEAASTPVIGVSGIPKGVGAEEGQLAAVLYHAAHLHHLEPVAQLREDVLVPFQHLCYIFLYACFVILCLFVCLFYALYTCLQHLFVCYFAAFACLFVCLKYKPKYVQWSKFIIWNKKPYWLPSTTGIKIPHGKAWKLPTKWQTTGPWNIQISAHAKVSHQPCKNAAILHKRRRKNKPQFCYLLWKLLTETKTIIQPVDAKARVPSHVGRLLFE